jgi:dipeptidyl aminopeptidase/acylaminoacyl peptidase
MIASTGLRPRLARQGLYHALATGLPVAVNRPGASRLTRAVATIGLGVAALGTGQTLHAQVPVGVHRTTGQPPWSLALTPAPPVTVADLIEMTTLGSQLQGDGHDDEHVFSRDGAHLAVVVKRGNLARNTVDFALLIFRSDELLRGPKPDTILTLASSSNRPAITRVRWLTDNTTLAFLGERPGEGPQVYTLDTRTRALTARTHATTVITTFDVAPSGEPLVYAAEEPVDTTPYARMRVHGFVVPARAVVSDLIAGDWLSEPKWMARQPRSLHVIRQGRDTLFQLPDSAHGYTDCGPGSISLGPKGDVALLTCTPRTAPAWWAGYTEERFRWEADRSGKSAEYVVLDLTTGHVRPLMDTPVSWATHFVWAPEGKSVVVANALLPLIGPDSAERATHAMVAEVDVHTGAVSVVVPRDSLVVQGWDRRTGIVELVPGLYPPAPTGNPTHLFSRKTPQGWRRTPAGVAAGAQGPAVRIDQGLNTPPRLVAVDPRTHDMHVVYDPTPGSLAAHRFGREEVLHWTTTTGETRVGGLYWPPDYVPGRRYPLVIQTHGFDSTAFWPYGVFTTGEAAQPLASAGIMVLQLGDPPAAVEATPREAPWFQASVEGAINALDRRGLIDRTKVGLQGFSRTCFLTLYFLTHSSYPIATATVNDGVDFSYLQYLLFALVYRGIRPPWPEMINGGPPFGTSLAEWLRRAPGFNLDHVTAPLRLTALQPFALLTEWEPYAGLLLQGKPAELVYIPDGAHILTKPWERLTSQQGAVDWYRFWLKGEEDLDPTKREQYERWRRLRTQHEAVLQRQRTGH